MLAPNSLISLNQGSDLARWNMQRLYGTPAAEAEREMEEDTSTEAVSATSCGLRLSGVLIALRLLALWRPRHSMTGNAAR